MSPVEAMESELESLDQYCDAELEKRPATRGQCKDGERPCPWVGCRYHLYLDVSSTGRIMMNHKGLEPWEIGETCALDMADRGGMTLVEVGRFFGNSLQGGAEITRERIRQIEEKAVAHVSVRFLETELREVFGDVIAVAHIGRDPWAGDDRIPRRLVFRINGAGVPLYLVRYRGKTSSKIVFTDGGETLGKNTAAWAMPQIEQCLACHPMVHIEDHGWVWTEIRVESMVMSFREIVEVLRVLANQLDLQQETGEVTP